ncbi:UNVERIFIED_CONTAM: hypothetical protein ABIC26_003018, partial [Paenibacillus sp. PvR008]
EDFVERLDETYQLDALKDLANVYRSLRDWDKVDEIAKKMKKKAEIQYSMKHQQKKRECDESKKKLSRPMFVYITYADLLCAGVCESREDYEQALQFTYAYADLSWVKETDEDALYWISLFEHWAQANVTANKLLSGDINALYDYVEYIGAPSDTTEQDKVTQLLNIMMTANRYQIDVNDILQRFETDVNSLLQFPQSNDIYTKQVIPEQFARFGYELAYYYLYRGMYNDGFKYLMYSMVKAHTLNNKDYFINCTGLFAHFQAYALPETREEYFKLLEKVWLDNVKKNGTADRRS